MPTLGIALEWVTRGHIPVTLAATATTPPLSVVPLLELPPYETQGPSKERGGEAPTPSLAVGVLLLFSCGLRSYGQHDAGLGGHRSSDTGQARLAEDAGERKDDDGRGAATIGLGKCGSGWVPPR
jgi:hypothetical protein